ncbi:MAG: hypothetical protein ACREMK_10105 [Gemmatimonadota bacterium]
MPDHGPSHRPGYRLPREAGGIGLAIVAVIALALILGFVGYWFLMKDTGEKMVESTATMDRGVRHLGGLEYMHPFTPPADGVVDPDRATVFSAVTDEAWRDMEAGFERLNAMDTGDEGDRPSLRDVAEGVGGLGEMTLALGGALSRHDMALSEYMWTGLQLLLGAGYTDELFTPGASTTPEANQRLAESYRGLLDDIRVAAVDSTQSTGRGTVYWAGLMMASLERQVWVSPGMQSVAAVLIDAMPSRESRDATATR